MELGQPHFIKQIAKLVEETRNKWAALIRREGNMYTEVNAKYNTKKKIYEWIEKHSMSQQGLSGRSVCRDVERFQKFDEEFKRQVSLFEEYNQELDVVKLHSLNAQFVELSGTLDREYSYLQDICEPDFIYETYKPCLDTCPVPKDPYETDLINEILSLKVRQGEQNIAAAKNVRFFNPQELAEAVNQIQHQLGRQAAQMNAYFSLFGNLKDTALFVGNCMGTQKVLETVRGQIEEFNEALSSSVKESRIGIIQNDEKLSAFSVSFDCQFQNLEESLKKGLQSHTEMQEELIAQVEEAFATFKQLKEQPTSSQYESTGFIKSKQMLDRMISTFNQPINGFIPELNERGQSKLADCIIKHGWKWSIQEINGSTDTLHTVDWRPFEGLELGAWSLQQGHYYGQLSDSKRDGLGLVYCTNPNENPWLFECVWQDGVPVSHGRFTLIANNKWFKFEGGIDGQHGLTGECHYEDEDGDQYRGEYREGRRHGKGRWRNADGSYQEGEWRDGEEMGRHRYYSKEGVLVEEK
ncbi:hypothetical protein FGO68_gene3095 [Halteria grandinella]|uniref:Uncharacterized protein n=1 Tax=Halteria grandinella TaxID=5974 RepID=A0A8J8NRC8_HALGN|nr:hypothetical protein FGO68_gene3095 [Halteria grandinella]